MNAGAVCNSTVLRADVGRFPIILISSVLFPRCSTFPVVHTNVVLWVPDHLQDLS